jgi:allantoinase
VADCDLLIRGGTVVAPGGAALADLAVADGSVVAVGQELGLTAAEELDATGLHVLAGVVDAHVHFNEPGRAEWEGFATGSAALAAGGGTTFVDMPLNAHPPTVDADAFRAKVAAAERSSLTDFALWGGLVPGPVDRLDDLAALGVVGFKAFMSPSGIDDFEAADDATLQTGMARAARLGLPVAVHAENAEIVTRLAGLAVAAGRTGWRDWCESRPAAAELEAIGRAIGFAEEAGCALHVVHVSTAAGVRLVAEARARGVDVSCETCPHYLLLDEDDLERLGAVAKCAPPLRAHAERDALRAELRAGAIDLVASDHSPAPASLKAGDAFAAWGGVSGCQSLLGVLLGEVDVAQAAALSSRAPADRLRLPRKGRLEPGYDADLALVDLAVERKLRAEDLLYRHRHSPFVGRTLRGRVVRTLVRGHTVVQDGRVVAEPAGQLVRPAR